jgi:glutamine synthetase
MYVYDNFTVNGVHIHLSMSESKESNYIFVHNIYENRLTMKYFTRVEDAIEFIHSIRPLED